MRSGGADRKASNELFSRDFSDEKEIHSTPTSSREHANTVGDRFRQRVRSSWFGDLLRWRARTSCHTDSGCDRNACANSHPVSNFCAAHPSAPVRWGGFSEKCQSPWTDAKRIPESATKLGGRAGLLCQRVEDYAFHVRC